MADFWVRKLGGSSKAAAVDLSNAMSVAAFNAATFDANDRIFFSGIDGDLTTAVIPASGGISLLADPNYGCTVHGSDTIVSCIDIVSKNSIEVDGIKVTHPTTDGVQIRGTSIGVVIKNVESSYSGNQAFQMEETTNATFYNITGRNCVDDGFSLHDDATAVIYGANFRNNGQGINIISATTLTAYDCVISGSVNPSVDVVDSNFIKTPRLRLVRAIVSGGSKNLYAGGNGDITIEDCVFDMVGTNHGIDIENTGKLLVKRCVFYNVPTAKHAIVFRVGSTCNGVYKSIFASSLGGGVYSNVNSDVSNCIFTGLAVGVTRVAGVIQLSNSCLFENTANTSGTITQSNNITSDPKFVSSTDYHLRTDSPCLGAGTKISGITTDIEGNPLVPPYNIGPYGLSEGALGVSPVANDGPSRNNITRLTGTSTTIDPAGTYELADTNAWRVVTGWTAGTANDFFDENGVPIPFTGQQLIAAGIGPQLYCGLKGIAGYLVDQEAAANAKIIRILKVPTYIDTLYWSDSAEMDWSASNE